MALRRCPDCGREVSESAPACPQCGRPFQAAHKVKLVVRRRNSGCGCGALLLFIVFGAIVSQRSENGAKPKATVARKPEDSAAATARKPQVPPAAKARKPEDSAAAKVTTSRGTISVPGTAFLDGRDLEARPPITVTDINVWDSQQRRKVVCKLKHGAAVSVRQSTELDGRFYFRIQSGACEGWIPESFLNPNPPSP